METTALIIQGTPGEIAEGLQQFAERHAAPAPKSDFREEKMTVRQAADFIGISYKTLCSRITRGLVRVYGTGRTRFVVKNELIEDFKTLK